MFQGMPRPTLDFQVLPSVFLLLLFWSPCPSGGIVVLASFSAVQEYRIQGEVAADVDELIHLNNAPDADGMSGRWKQVRVTVTP